MRRLHDYLDFDIIQIKCKDNDIYQGTPTDVSYPDDTGYKEECIHIDLENGSGIAIFESEIESIEIIEE